MRVAIALGMAACALGCARSRGVDPTGGAGSNGDADAISGVARAATSAQGWPEEEASSSLPPLALDAMDAGEDESPPISGDVTVGVIDASGGDPPDNAARVVGGLARGMRDCYNKALATDPSARGYLAVRVTIARSGEITSATPRPGSKLPKGLVACVLRKINNAQFDPLRAPMTLLIPLAFERRGAGGAKIDASVSPLL